ncbi:flagellar hook-basal body complex protein FliE [Granulicella sp. 5B5]|uniref:flagellar hook-basal body complex protein FliE n=1 Tax=Granulicella sp. 5B5 TaxID=1617967 RepID=UPI0015F37D87|nr:flagellar hook-basal body complex protein FliE [Granulicella sp. 5B5]QMV17527.1 flagellar hook-basal body complex protein FliE [Granulicella sp. 5B5]
MSHSITGLGSITPWSEYAEPNTGTSGGQGGFSGVLKNALSEVNQLSTGADAQIGSLMQGGAVDMNGVMVAVEKADVAFQLMMQVRNKIVSAYQDIEKMQF